MVIGSLVALVIVVLFLSYTFNNIGSVFRDGPVSVPAIIASPTPSVRSSAAAVTMRIRELNRLETTSYTIEKVIDVGVEGNTLENLLFGDRLLLIAQGDVIAGIDLNQLQEEDVIVSADGMSITLKLPPVRIFDVSLDNDETRVYDREQGLFAAPNQDLETIARQQGEQAILQTACEDGILQRATRDGKEAMGQFLGLLDFERVEVQTSPPEPCVDPAPDNPAPDNPAPDNPPQPAP
jgi:hypothetical protein